MNSTVIIGSATLHLGDCLDVMRGMADNSVDSIVTDPPYGLNFMGKKWDYDVPSEAIWAECLRVLKPGGHLLAFAGTRTQHRMACRIEDAGFEIRDMIAWVYGSGFPKSHNLHGEHQGWGTALKPALEPITMARKSFVCTVADNVMEHGTGALNIDGCRVGVSGGSTQPSGMDRYNAGLAKQGYRPGAYAQGETDAPEPAGRWPANLVHDGSDEVLANFPQSAGQQGDVLGTEPSGVTNGIYGDFAGIVPSVARNDSGSASRFFYCAKTSSKDRHDGMDNPGTQFRRGTTLRNVENTATKGNTHPTVKPADLMRYLCRLVTPPGGVVLDPFMGSGSTGKAAGLESFGFVGCEREKDYFDIAVKRVRQSTAQERLFA